MTLQEASEQFGIDEDTLLDYKKNGLLHCRKQKNTDSEYDEMEIEFLCQYHFLREAGMDICSLEQLLCLEHQEDGSAAQIRILRNFRYELLNSIHKKQQYLDTLDYLIYQIKEQAGGIRLKMNSIGYPFP